MKAVVSFKGKKCTYKTSSRHSISDPNAITSHHVRHHYISRQAITNNSYLIGSRDAGVGVCSEVCHDLFFATRLLGRVSEDLDAGVGLK